MRLRLRIMVTTAVVSLGATAVLVAPIVTDRSTADAATAFPTMLSLPDGFQPEGIAIGPGPIAYVGSLKDGSIYRADLVTGTGSVLTAGSGTPSVGLKTDKHGRLFAAGGTAGDARVIDTRSGTVLADYQFASGPSFVNDDTVALGSVWFTDSTNPVLYRLPLADDGQLPAADQVAHVPLTGDIAYGPGFNANGISPTPDGRSLLIVQSNTGLLFRVDPWTGVTSKVDLGGASLIDGDGILLVGSTLYVVQNVMNTVTVVSLDHAGTRGSVVGTVVNPRFDVPTTVASFGNRLYLPNSRFTTSPTASTPYSVLAVSAAR